MSSPAPSPDAVLAELDTLGPPGTPVTTPEVAEGFDCTQRTIYNRLDSLVDDGVLKTKKVGANSRVWWQSALQYNGGGLDIDATDPSESATGEATRTQREPADDPLTPLADDSEMARRTREFDWSETSLGPAVDWPDSLKTAVEIMLTSRYPMFIWWGDNLIHFYNDAYIPVLGDRHPDALGEPAPEVWSDAWPTVGPQADAVMEDGESTWNQDLLMTFTRNGYPEEVYFTFSYSPIFDDAGEVAGIFCACTEETQRVLGQRRVGTLRELADQASYGRTVEEAFQLSAETLAENRADIPFAALYRIDDEGQQARVAGTVGLDLGDPAAPSTVDLTASEPDTDEPPDGTDPSSWPIARVARTGEIEYIDDVEARFGSLPGGEWPDPPQEALVLPIVGPGRVEPYGVLVAGVSPRRRLNDDYRSFFELAVGHIASAVTGARAYEQERKRAEELAELDRAKTTFFNNVSHEFRTPLTLMLGPLEDALAAADDLPPEQRERLEVAHRSSQRLLKLVNTLLDFSRIETGRVQASYEPTDLADLTADLASNFRAAIERAGMELRVDTPPLSEPVYVDREMWEKIVLNLLSNAFKHTFEGEIAVSVRAVDDHAELEVRDTGTGIPEEELPALFDRFHQVEGARARSQEGSGIGLALVNNLVALHDGDIEVESTVGEGSTFTIRVPLGTEHLPEDRIEAERTLDSTTVGAGPYVEEALRWLPDDEVAGDERDSAVPDAAPQQVGLPAPGARVLVADDNTDMREYLERLLGRQWDVRTVADGEAALSAAREWTPDLVLADVMMPGMDGFELLASLRDDPEMRDLPIIMLSARAGEDSRVEGLEAGADDYMVKPFSARELVARVGATLELAQVREEADQKIRESEERLDAFVTTTSDVVYRMSPDWSEMYYLDGQEFIVDTEEPRETWLTEYIPDDEQERVMAAIEDAIETKSTFELEHQVMQVDGTRGWVHSRAVPMLDDDGEITEWFGTASDITERKEKQQELRETRELLEIALDVEEMGVWELDLQTRESPYRSPRHDEIFGYDDPVEDWSLERALDHFHPDDREAVREQFDAALESGNWEFESRIIRADGEQRWIRAKGTFFYEDETPIRGVGTVQDITERKEAEQNLRETTEKLELATAAGEVGLWTRDMETDIVSGDAFLAETYGMDPDAVAAGAPLEQFFQPVHEEDRDQVWEAIQRAEDKTDEMAVEYRVQDAEGNWHWAEARAKMEYDEHGEQVRFNGTMVDITERKERLQQLERQAKLDGFRVTLTDAIRPLSDPVEIQRTAARVLGEKLGADRVQYGDVLDDENTNVVHADYHRDDMDSLAGEHQLDAYGECIAEGFRAGETLAVDDVETFSDLSEEVLETCRQAQIRAWVGVPLVKGGTLEAFLSVTEADVREWTDIEVEMIEEMAERTWAAVERAHAEQAHRESEERYRMLFESIIEGFCTIEVLFDEGNEPVDYRFLETNPAFEDQTGLDGAEGKRMKELEPNHEDHWFERYGRIAQTGEPERFTNRAEHLGDRWYDVHAFRIGDPEERKVAIAFKDISDSKHYQIALERLNEASRELIDADAETINDRVAELTRDVLDVEYATLWRYDEVSGEIREHASSTVSGIDSEALRLPDESTDTVWETFIGGDIDVQNDLDIPVDEPSRSLLRSRVILPLGRHGVVCLGSTQVNSFDERTVDLVETFAATVETAWDRADGEAELADRNEELARLDRLNTLIREIDKALVAADTREEIDDAVCERLADSDLYEAAWLATYDSETDTLRPQTWAGIDSRHLEDRTVAVGDASSDDPLVAAHRTREIQVVSDIAVDARAAGWREDALGRGARSCLTLPLVYEESIYGILTVYGRAPQPDERETDVLAELGGTIAHTIYTLEATTTRRTDSIVELTLQTTMAETPLVRLARELDCVIAFEGLVPGADGDTTVFFTAHDVSPEELVAANEQLLAIEDLQHVAARETGPLFEARLTEETLPTRFLERGATIESLRIDAGTVTAVLELSESAEVREFVEQLQRDMSDLELLSRRTRTRESGSTLQQTVLDRLTPRQQEVLQLAYRSGYFEMPRVQTGEELADVLGIVPSTFAKHIRSAERNVLDVIFANGHELQE
ncbi:GAF domain-containing protein [Natrinema gelatinilyticum]|uniref:GAF domain-containing protein n=1 Tax=Natrinema gelatinilyticum TaxID=2961571 RepID=UPI0020C42D8D|nr:GAF domain-containing protein [Natrinema gelatinilyticum]